MGRMHMRLAGAVALVAASALANGPAGAEVKIGMVTTLSGPPGYLGEDVRDAFQLAIEQGGGKLGGVPVTLLVEDDKLKPGDGKQIAEKFLKSDGVKILTGVIFSNVAGAVIPAALEAGAFYISPNAGPSTFAGEKCDPNYFVVSWQNDNLHESAGALAQKLGYKKMAILAPNYQAGKDALTGFKRLFKGEIVLEQYVKLDQTDFAAEIAQIRAAKPDAAFYFLPGGLGINFLKQYAQAGMKGEVPLVLSAPSLDTKIAGLLGEAALGVRSTSQWTPDLDNPASKAFVAAFKAKFNRLPTEYASQGYDTALLIGAALKAVGGDVGKADDFRAALRKAEFASVRGAFKFGANQHPVQNWYERVVEKGADGATFNKTVGKVLENHADAYVGACKMPR